MTAPLLAALRHRSLQRPFISFELEKRMWRFAYKRGVPRLGEQSETYSRGAGRHVFAALHSLDRIAPSRGFDREERFLPQPPSTCWASISHRGRRPGCHVHHSTPRCRCRLGFRHSPGAAATCPGERSASAGPGLSTGVPAAVDAGIAMHRRRIGLTSQEYNPKINL